MKETSSALLDATRDWLPTDGVLSARDRCSAPWRTVVVGRRSAGKSTIVNLAAGESGQATGLGGVTQSVAEVAVGEHTFVDTPGIGTQGVYDALLDALDDADAILWVVDGLHPVTLTERRLLREGRLGSTVINVVVTHLDLVDEQDVEGVLERVRSFSEPLGVSTVTRCDLREPQVRIPEPIRQVGATSPARRAILRAAADAVDAALDELPPPGLETLTHAAREIWSAEVGRAMAETGLSINVGRVHKGATIDGLRHVATAARQRAEAAIGALPRPDDLGAPALPLPPRRARTLVGEALGAWGGEEGARRVLRAHAAGWLADGHLALIEWIESSRLLAAGAARRARARAAVAEARAAAAR